MGAISWHEYKDRINRYFWFNKTELRDFILVVFVFAFILSFDKWGVNKFDVALGLKNLFIALFFVAISVFLHHAVQRLAALYLGYKPEQKIWWFGILICLIFLIFSNGRIMIFAGSYLSKFIPGKKLKKSFGYFVILMATYILTREIFFE